MRNYACRRKSGASSSIRTGGPSTTSGAKVATKTECERWTAAA